MVVGCFVVVILFFFKNEPFSFGLSATLPKISPPSLLEQHFWEQAFDAAESQADMEDEWGSDTAITVHRGPRRLRGLGVLYPSVGATSPALLGSACLWQHLGCENMRNVFISISWNVLLL